jgi:cephalosporin hydroxylase
MDPHDEFKEQCREEVRRMGQDDAFRLLSRKWMDEAQARRYSYHFEWMGLPIIQYPHDIVVMQEIVWNTKPELIIETGTARGGSLIFYASLLSLLGHGEVVGVDVDIRPHNRRAIESHPMASRIRLIEGSSVDLEVIRSVAKLTSGRRTLVVLDSNHTHDHVLAELRAYAPLVSPAGYCVVMDTVIEELPADTFDDRPWGRGNSPKTAVKAFLLEDDRFELDLTFQHKLGVTVAPDGYLRRIKP